MRNLERDGLIGNKFSPTRKQIADEIADVVTYLDLLAHVLGVDLGRAAVAKFNEVSERVGFPDRIALASRPQPARGEVSEKTMAIALALDAAARVRRTILLTPTKRSGMPNDNHLPNGSHRPRRAQEAG
jgi:hypothetical protein